MSGKTSLALLLLIISLIELIQAQKNEEYYRRQVENRKGRLGREYVPGSTCDRQCDGNSRSCYFEFRVETYYTMSKACYNCPDTADDCFRPMCVTGGGVRRTVVLANRQLPGPSIVVCQGDEVMVHVENMIDDAQATTIHWHGQHLIEDQYMDGVPFVTQCPVHSGNNFTYEFWANDAGTYFWHSHVRVQRGDGLFGPLIVRQSPRQNYHRSLYDSDLTEHVIIVTDWNNITRLDMYNAYAQAGAFMEPTSILVNGLGYQFNNGITVGPLANFRVERGRRYRIRLINAGFVDCPIEMTIDNHRLLAIASDGADIVPRAVDSIVSSSGERYDFVLEANQSVSSYWIRFKGYFTCERLGTFQIATLQYAGSNNQIPTTDRPTYANAARTDGVVLNPTTMPTPGRTPITVDQLRAVVPNFRGLNTNNPRKFYISLDMSDVDEPWHHAPGLFGFYQVAPDLRARTSQLNHITFRTMDWPLMPARDSIDETRFCNAQTVRNMNCTSRFCACTHVNKINLGDVVELILVEEANQDDAPALHPMHLHGYHYRVVGWGVTGPVTMNRIMQMDNNGELRRNFNNPPLKDTVGVPRGGYTIVRFLADNPGFWFFHCHIDVHSSYGMEMVFKVGENWQMPDPPEDFPICGNYDR